MEKEAIASIQPEDEHISKQSHPIKSTQTADDVIIFCFPTPKKDATNTGDRHTTRISTQQLPLRLYTATYNGDNEESGELLR